MVLALDKALQDVRVSVLHRSTGARIAILEPFDVGANVVEKMRYSANILLPYSALNVTIRQSVNLDLFSNGDLILLEASVYGLDGKQTYDVINQFYIGESQYTDKPLDSVTFTCRDLMLFASNSEYSETMNRNETAAKFIKRIAEKYQFPIHDIEETDVLLESHIFDNATLYKMWLTAITLDMNKSKRLYRLYMKYNGLVLESFKSRQKGWVFEAQTANGNIVVSDRKVSVFDKRFANSIVSYVPSGQNQNSLDQTLSALTASPQNVVLTDDDSITKYGLFQKRLNINNMNETEALDAANVAFQPDPLDDIKLLTLPFFGIKLYDIIYIINSRINAASQYFVNDIVIDINAGAGRMQL